MLTVNFLAVSLDKKEGGRTDCGRIRLRARTATASLFDADQQGGVITINSPGQYQIMQNLHYSIIIAVSDVLLDLNGYTVTSDSQMGAIIAIAPGASNVSIYDGSLYNIGCVGKNCGIEVGSGAAHIFLENLKIFNCVCGVLCAGTEDKKIIDCEFKQLELIANVVGMQLMCVCDTVMKDCSATSCVQAGFELLQCESTSLFSCQVLKTMGAACVAAFSCDSGKNNLLQRCVAKNTTTESQKFGDSACGFLLRGCESNTKIIECSVNETECVAHGESVAYGVCCAPVQNEQGSFVCQGSRSMSSAVLSVAWSPDNRYLASGLAKNNIHSVCVYSYDGCTFIPVTSQGALAGDTFAVAWSPDGNYLACADSAGYLRLFRFNGETLHHVVSEDVTSPISCVAWSPNGKYLACGDGDKNIRIYSFDGVMLSQKLINDACAASVLSLSWSPDSKYLVSGDFGGAVRVYSVSESLLVQVASSNVPHEYVWSVAWSPRGNYIVTGDQGGEILVFALDGYELVNLASDTSATGAVQSVAWSPDGKYIVSGDLGNMLRVVQFDGLRLSAIKQERVAQSVYSVAWSFDGSTIACGDSLKKLSLYTALCAPKSCLVENCRVCDTRVSDHGINKAFGIVGSGNFVRNLCCNNEVNYGNGIGNVVHGKHNKVRNTVQPFDNISMPAV